MEKQQAKGYLEEVLKSKFDLETFELFARNLLNEYEPKGSDYSGSRIPEKFRDHIAHYRRIGKYTDPEGEVLEIVAVQVRATSKLERTRTALRNFVVHHLKNVEQQFALVAFYAKEDQGADWRLSLVKIEYETERNEQGKIKTTEELVPAKRFSFLVGEYEDCYTAQKQLLPLLTNDYSNPLILKEKDGDGSLEGAFSVEKVTDEFYEQYRELYLWLVEQPELVASLNQENLAPERFVKKLLGQIVFLYFLQKKGWLGVDKEDRMGEGSKRFLQKRFGQVSENGKNYFNDFLRHLFYAALAREHHDEGIPYYFQQLDCKIPFLNGGLFEAEYKWDRVPFNLPNELFRNDQKNKAGDRGTGILDVFDRYNFTIKEDEPLEREVAVDPEMLGKVFENMLEVTERKSKGAFYTPREIVHYMCQESLIHYLDNTINHNATRYQSVGSSQLSLASDNTHRRGQAVLEQAHADEPRVPKADIEDFIRYGHQVLEHEAVVTEKGRETRAYRRILSDSIRTYAAQLDQALADIKICDPAIGSGAFPVGLLQEIVTARSVLNSILQEEQHTPYFLKRHAIRESIYGVDIDPSAIDIARLRLWLSLVVDEEDYDAIEALPNLDYKIVCGNSLIGLPEQGADRYPQLSDELESLKAEFFNTTDEKRKRELKNIINQQIGKVLTAAEDFEGYKIDFDFKLLFSEVWHQKGGFDVVIGNPPYLRIQGIRKEDTAFADRLVKLYEAATGSFDLYVCFVEKALGVTHSKGLANFIMPVKWTHAAFGKGLRSLIRRSKAISKIISFSAYQVFHASTYTGIQLFQKKSSTLQYHELKRDLPNKSDLDYYINNLPSESFNTISSENLAAEAWTLTDKQTALILDKLDQHELRVKDVFSKFFTGLQTSKDSVYFIMDCRTDKGYVIGYSAELKEEVKIERGLVKPLLKGDQVHRYEKLKSDNYVIFPYRIVDGKAGLMDEDMIKNEFPLGYSYLKRNESVLRGRENGRLEADDYWFRYIYPKNLTLFDKVKLICPDISKGGNYAFDESGVFYSTATLYGYIKDEDVIHSYEFYLGLLNSTICWYFLKNIGTVLANNYFRFKPAYVEKFPLPNPDISLSAKVGILSDYITQAKHYDSLINQFFESLMDGITFDLYFPEQLKSANKQILPHLTDLKPLTDEMSEEEKLGVIQSEFERLYDPNHPVRNNLETLDSIEEVRIIREALK